MLIPLAGLLPHRPVLTSFMVRACTHTTALDPAHSCTTHNASHRHSVPSDYLVRALTLPTLLMTSGTAVAIEKSKIQEWLFAEVSRAHIPDVL